MVSICNQVTVNFTNKRFKMHICCIYNATYMLQHICMDLNLYMHEHATYLIAYMLQLCSLMSLTKDLRCHRRTSFAHLNKFQRISLNFNLTDLLLSPFQSLNYGTGTLPVLHYCREHIQPPLYSPFCPLEGIQYLLVDLYPRLP